jgi:excisionase family DNA binding protein
MQELLSTREVADRLNVTIETVRRYCRSGELKCIRLSKRLIRVSLEELERFIGSNNNP